MFCHHACHAFNQARPVLANHGNHEGDMHGML
jgi:hypothetical protein